MQVRRAWPRAGGGITFEAVDIENRVRAGSISASGKITVAPFACDPLIPGLAEVVAGGELLVHRFKRRAVVRLRPTDGAPERYMKLLARGTTEHIAAVSEYMQRAAVHAGFDAPQVEDVSQGRIVLSAVPGTSLHDLGERLSAAAAGTTDPAEAAGQWDQAWQLWASRWPSLVSAPPDGEEDGSDVLVSHDGAAEAATLKRWADHLVEHHALNFRNNKVQALAEAISEDLSQSAGLPLGLSHRDLHDKQILFDPATARLGLVDFDTASLAEPALDLANLAVHLEFRVAQGILQPALARSANSAVAEAVEALNVRADRFDAYRRSTRLRLACVYAFRPAWRPLAQEWLDGLL